MTTKRKRKRTEKLGREPEVHVKVAHAQGNLHGMGPLVKPALLYADKVTIYSPMAAIFEGVRSTLSLTDPRQQMAAFFQLVRDVPALAPDLAAQLEANPKVVQGLDAMLRVNPRLIRAVARKPADKEAIDNIYRGFDKMADTWADGMPGVIEKLRELTGADELMVALDAGAVSVAPLIDSPGPTFLSDSIALALGEQGREPGADLLAVLVSHIAEMLTEGRSFPLLDDTTSGFIKALDERGELLQVSGSTWRRGSEMTAAASFMGFLPYFSEMPMDEVLDLRNKLRGPLVRFRAAMADLSREFESRPIDRDFVNEVEEAWRRRVEPALQEIRESLAEHGLLREIASIALGDPRKLMLEAGGVLAAAQGHVISVSRFMAIAMAAGLPTIDLVGRATQRVRESRRTVRTNAFYFLHRVSEEARR